MDGMGDGSTRMDTWHPESDEVDQLLLNARLRDELRFGSVEAMAAQMHDDARLARRLLGDQG